MKARTKRIMLTIIGLMAVGGAAVLALQALRSNVAYFFSPTQVVTKQAPLDQVFRLGGLVEKGSLKRQGAGLQVEFSVTDLGERVMVVYEGILPDLFKEGQGVVTKGRLGADGRFYAEQVLAKHDETYMPPEVANTLRTDHVKGVVRVVTGKTQ